MAGNFANSWQSADLRERAEAKLKLAAEEQGHEAANFSPWAAHLIHELQTHQIELEIQNETLRQTHLELIESHERFSDLYDFAPVGYLTLDQDCKIVGANLRIADMLDVNRGTLIGNWLQRLVAPEDQDTFYLDFRTKFKQGDRTTSDLRLLKADGSYFPVRLLTVAIREREEVRRLVAIADANSLQPNTCEAEGDIGQTDSLGEVLKTLEVMSASAKRLALLQLMSGTNGDSSDASQAVEIQEVLKGCSKIKELVAADERNSP